MERRMLPTLGFGLICLTLNGCVSLFANGLMMERSDPPGLYAGVRASVQGLKDSPKPASPILVFAHCLMVLDLPVEAAMDTVLLPYITVCTIEWYARMTPSRRLNLRSRQKESEQSAPQVPQDKIPADVTEKPEASDLPDLNPREREASAIEQLELSNGSPTLP